MMSLASWRTFTPYESEPCAEIAPKTEVAALKTAGEDLSDDDSESYQGDGYEEDEPFSDRLKRLQESDELATICSQENWTELMLAIETISLSPDREEATQATMLWAYDHKEIGPLLRRFERCTAQYGIAVDIFAAVRAPAGGKSNQPVHNSSNPAKEEVADDHRIIPQEPDYHVNRVASAPICYVPMIPMTGCAVSEGGMPIFPCFPTMLPVSQEMIYSSSSSDSYCSEQLYEDANGASEQTIDCSAGHTIEGETESEDNSAKQQKKDDYRKEWTEHTAHETVKVP